MTPRIPHRSRRVALFLIPVLFAAAAVQRPALAADDKPGAGSRQQSAVEAVLQAQTAAWSSGDLATFSSYYATDSIFVSPNGVTRGGPSEIYDRYRKRYTDPRAMGELTLDVEDYQSIGKTGAAIVARWTLRFPKDPSKEEATGMTLLVFRKEGGSWVISRDASM